MKTTSCFSALLVCLSLFGCKPKETTLSGQVFIVTRGAENIKLGLVEVQLIQKQPAVEFLQKKQSAIDSEIKSRKDEYSTAKLVFDKVQADFESLKATNNFSGLSAKYETTIGKIAAYDRENLSQANQLETLSNDFQDAKRTYETATGNLRVYYREVATQKGNAAGDFARASIKWHNANSAAVEEDLKEKSRLFDELKQFEPLAQKMEERKQQLESLALKLDEASHPKFDALFTGFSPVVIQQATTDADGKFLILYPQDKTFAMYAKAERVIGEERETYYWLVNAPSGVEKAQIFLSNQNLVTVDPDGYFKTKPKSELQEPAP